ncbi:MULTISPECIES: MFS transporter [unclassified Pseudomonas]|uniref:MFS transporter n=1 Tax=unclassified Pseudomonas TaxID=196821 RepID=UPI000891261A|nr:MULTISPECIES: MFS transporter [unclassified Pseudomonas]UVL56088.1 MFS transporter [Pseudomonas sp. B21-035]SDQ30108.1 Cyanate permease [Pseudomonas sp. UC 17F4]
MSAIRTEQAAPGFGLLCLASYLLSLSYGSTFLLSLLVSSRGGNEQDAGQIISVAMLSTIVAVLGSGHLADRLGSARAIALSALSLVAACLGFALVPGTGAGLMLCGLMLGLGWGAFYTLGPILVAERVEAQRRTHCFALLSGSMMSGIGSGPLAGKLAALLQLPVQTAFYTAAGAAVAGLLIFNHLARQPRHATQPVGISRRAGATVLASPARWPVLMVGLGGAIFGGLGSFQTSYAAGRGLDYSLFFIGFMSAAISCRLLIAGWVVKRDAYRASCLLSGFIVLAVLALGWWVQGNLGYLLAAALLGVGYGLNYSVINGLAANQAPPGHTPQALLLFSLAYFLGVFGFPWLAGQLIVSGGTEAMMLCLLLVALLNWAVSLGRLFGRRRARNVAQALLVRGDGKH